VIGAARLTKNQLAIKAKLLAFTNSIGVMAFMSSGEFEVMHKGL
jgi:hypothetical protein